MNLVTDGRVMLNLGRGSRAHPDWNNLDFSPLVRPRQHRCLASALRRVGILSQDRWQRLQSMPAGILLRDLRRRLPFDDESVDVVYHSHVLEHIDHDQATPFLRECHRVLNSGGVLRVVVPDLELLVQRYLLATRRLIPLPSPDALAQHSQAVNDIFQQMVRREPVALRSQPPVVRILERALRGAAEAAGELHRWMYDRLSLTDLLKAVGFRTVLHQQSPTDSLIQGWADFHLDVDPDGTVHVPGSLYMEARK